MKSLILASILSSIALAGGHNEEPITLFSTGGDLPKLEPATYQLLCTTDKGLHLRGKEKTTIWFNLEDDGKVTSKATLTKEQLGEITDYYASNFAEGFKKNPDVRTKVRNFLNRQIKRPLRPTQVEMVVVSKERCPGCDAYAPAVKNLINKFGKKVRKLSGGEAQSEGITGFRYVPYTRIYNAKTKEVLFEETGPQQEATVAKLIENFEKGAPIPLEEAIKLHPKSGKKLIPCSETPVASADGCVGGVCPLPGTRPGANTGLEGMLDVLKTNK